MSSKVHHLTGADLIVSIVKKTARRTRKPTLASVARQAAKAGLEVVRYEVDPDGKIIIVTEKNENINSNEWDRELLNGTH